MSKEYINLKAEDISKLLHETYNVPTIMCEHIRRCLQLLETIVNTDPNEALTEIFNIIYNLDCGTTFEQDKKLNECRQTIKRALYCLETTDNSNLSNALECFERIDNTLCLNNNIGKLEFGIDDEEHIDCDNVIGMIEDLETIKAALLKSQANARSEEILQKYYQEGITLDSVMALKKEMAELKRQVSEPKHYLKWEDLEFTRDEKVILVKMGDTVYKILYRCCDGIEEVQLLSEDEKCYYLGFTGKYKDNVQLFNDLYLEVVENSNV